LDLDAALNKYLEDQVVGDHARQELHRFAKSFGEASPEVSTIGAKVITDYVSMATGATVDGVRRLEPVREFLKYLYASGQTAKINLGKYVRSASKKKMRSHTPGPVVTHAQQEQHRLTEEGMRDLEGQLGILKDELPNVVKEITRTAADKDVRENAPLEAARERQGHIQSRIRDIESVLASALAISRSDSDGKVVGVGSTVSVKADDSKKSVNYTIVSPIEARPSIGKLSLASPVGKELLGKEVGDKVNVVTPRGATTFLVVSIH
jgi:transcription elongation factor GreA